MSLRENASKYYTASVGFNAMGLGAVLWMATVALLSAQTAFLYQDATCPRESEDRTRAHTSLAVVVLTVVTLVTVCADFALNRARCGWVTMLSVALGSAATLLQVALLASMVRGPAARRVLRFAFAAFALQQASNSVQLAAIFNHGRFRAP